MKQIPLSLQQRIISLVDSYYLIAENQLKRRFPRPALSFRQRGKIAGSAQLKDNEIRLNPVLLSENTELFLSQVIPHEICHLLVFKLFGRVRPHGKEWRELMQQLFNLKPEVTHSMDTASVSPKGYPYRCKCGPVELSIRRHNKVVRGKQQYMCRCCGEKLVQA